MCTYEDIVGVVRILVESSTQLNKYVADEQYDVGNSKTVFIVRWLKNITKRSNVIYY